MNDARRPRRDAALRLARRIPEVVECHRTTGEDCFIMKVYFVAMDELDEILDQFLAHGLTTTSIVQSTPVPPRELPLPGKARTRS